MEVIAVGCGITPEVETAVYPGNMWKFYPHFDACFCLLGIEYTPSYWLQFPLSLLVGQRDPGRGMVAGFFPSSHVAVNTGSLQFFRKFWA